MESISKDIPYLDHDHVEMDRDEAEEKCLVQQQVIMDQMKQLKKVSTLTPPGAHVPDRVIFSHFRFFLEFRTQI